MLNTQRKGILQNKDAEMVQNRMEWTQGQVGTLGTQLANWLLSDSVKRTGAYLSS